MRRSVYRDGTCVGEVVKYVGLTARTMGSDPAYGAYPANARHDAIVCTKWADAREYLISLTSYEFEVQQFTAAGWECVTTEATKDEAWERLREYQANQPEYLCRVKRVVAT